MILQAWFVTALLAAFCRPAGAAGAGRAGTEERVVGDAAICVDKSERGGEAAFNELARCRWAQGRPEEAVAVLRRGLKAHPASYEMRLVLARFLRLSGKFEEAMGLYRQAKELAPTTAGAYIEEGYSRLYTGDASGAERIFSSAVAITSAAPAALHHHGVALWNEGRIDEGILELERALAALDASERGSARERAHTSNWLARLYLEAGRAEKVEALLRTAVAASTPGEVAWNGANTRLAEALARRGAYQEAGETLDRLLRRCAAVGCPISIEGDAVLVLSRLQRLRGDPASAKASLNRAFRLAVSGPEPSRLIDWELTTRLELLMGIASDFQEIGLDQKALAAYRAATRYGDRVPGYVSYGNLLLNAGGLELRLGDRESARRHGAAARMMFESSGNVGGLGRAVELLRRVDSGL